METRTLNRLTSEAQDQQQQHPPKSLTPLHYSSQLTDILSNLYYRQSMLKDYKTCPQMMLYRWILQHQEENQFFSALLGTAGHKVIQHFHELKFFEHSYVEISHLFNTALQQTIEESSSLPTIQQQFDTITQQCNHYIPEYADMLRGYQKDQLNQEFHATVIEQSFVLSLTDEFNRLFLFTGTIDQAGFYEDGKFALRDIKFRVNDFRPGRTELKLELQISLYAYALRHGKPSCSVCKPVYTIDGQLIYAGPCDACLQKIGTPYWPELITGQCELIWMRDYTPRKKDEYARHIISETEKERNPLTGRMRKKQVTNPKWIEGYKKGDNSGPAHLITERSQSYLQVHIQDIIRLAGMIRDGRFYRNAGKHCEFWCKCKDPCLNMLESEIEDIDVTSINEHMCTIDPFTED